MRTKSHLKAEYVHECLEYDPGTGLLHWRKRPPIHFADLRACNTWNARFAGKLAFQTKDAHGYLKGQIDGSVYTASRVIWLMMTGAWPPDTVDHEDRHGDNNRWANLRLATHSQNMANRLFATSATGVKGVHLTKSARHGGPIRYEAAIAKDGKDHFLGTFDTVEEARAAYQQAAGRFHGKFSRTE